MSFKLDWAPIWDNRDLLVDGFVTTIMLSVLALVLALVIGVIVGTAGASTARLLRAGAAAYVELHAQHPAARAHVFLVHGAWRSCDCRHSPARSLGLALYSGAYVAEIVRVGHRQQCRGASA